MYRRWGSNLITFGFSISCSSPNFFTCSFNMPLIFMSRVCSRTTWTNAVVVQLWPWSENLHIQREALADHQKVCTKLSVATVTCMKYVVLPVFEWLANFGDDVYHCTQLHSLKNVTYAFRHGQNDYVLWSSSNPRYYSVVVCNLMSDYQCNRLLHTTSLHVTKG